jgi:hypothetical protein
VFLFRQIKVFQFLIFSPKKGNGFSRSFILCFAFYTISCMTYICNFTNMDAAWKILNRREKLFLKTRGHMDVSCSIQTEIKLLRKAYRCWCYVQCWGWCATKLKLTSILTRNYFRKHSYRKNFSVTHQHTENTTDMFPCFWGLEITTSSYDYLCALPLLLPLIKLKTNFSRI